MTTTYGIHRRRYFFADENGDALVPVDVLRKLHRDASLREVDRIAWLGRSYATDSLGSVLDAERAGAMPELPDCAYEDAYRACEAPAPFNLRDARPACALHAKA